MEKFPSRPSALLLGLAFAPLCQAAALSAPAKMPPSGKEFSREEYMVLNLNRGKDSAGTHISDALRQARDMVKDLDRSLRQVQQVEREYAKSKGRPDDKFLAATTDRLEQALKSAQQLASELELSREELKDNIHHALIMAP